MPSEQICSSLYNINMKNQYISIIPFSFLLFLLGCTDRAENLKSVQKEQFCLDEKTKEIIEIASVNKENVTQGIHLTGSIEVNPDKVISFVSLVDGIISNTYFSLGDKVSKGQVLAEMQSTELAALQAELNALMAQIEIAKMDLDAKKQMSKDGIASNRELIQAKNELRMLESEKQKVENNLSLYSASSTKNVFQIKAPTSGIITEKNINPGATITSDGATLFSISNLDNVWAMANIYATDIAHVHQGMQVELKTISYPNEIFKGKIDEIAPILDREAKVLKARIVLDNNDLKLKPGMIADILALKEIDRQAVAVPMSSMVFYDNINYLLVYTDDCTIEAREIAILTTKDDTIYIESGLSEDEKIITKNQLLVFEAL